MTRVPCFRCGKQETREFELAFYGIAVTTRYFCAECFADDLRDAKLWRVEFERLLARGASRAEANAQLIARMDAGEAPPEVFS